MPFDYFKWDMKDYGCVETCQSSFTFKYNLMAVCNAADGAFLNGGAVFYENFLLDVAVHCLRTAMKSINNDFIHLNGQRKFRFVYMPSALSLMKALNALRRAFDVKEELMSINMMNEKMGSVIGSLIQNVGVYLIKLMHP